MRSYVPKLARIAHEMDTHSEGEAAKSHDHRVARKYSQSIYEAEADTALPFRKLILLLSKFA